MAPDPRHQALDRLRELRDCLQAAPDAAALAPLVHECEQLINAVEAFHMEAIRFRVYGLQRRLASGELSAPDAAADLIGDAREALQAAGFRTR